MSGTELPLARLRTPCGPGRRGQPGWNPQRASSMPVWRYTRTDPRVPQVPGEPFSRSWPDRSVDFPPLWCSVDLRDGNQALPAPMDPRRKLTMFDLLVRMGFKEIEVGYPAASEADFAFIRGLVREGQVPDDVTISVFTPARAELIDRTFEAISGASRAIVHLCLATSCLWRDVVLGMSAGELRTFTVDAAKRVARLGDAMPGSRLRFEYSPETFNVTEPDFALDVTNAVTSAWEACPERPVTVNLPSTVETHSPNVYADQIEWMHRHLDRRASVILSVHPHNDRGGAVAAAELALMAGADRVEGTLFGSGERTGNVCLATLALNLFSHGIDPQLDFSDIDAIRRTVEFCNQMPVHARHPYVGDLVYTAFSGQHQDGIAKGLAALADRASTSGVAPGSLPWQVPYLPIDPRDVGRDYETVVRVNSQSGKGGIAHVLLSSRGLNLPRAMRVDLAKAVQETADESGAEINSRQLWEIFRREYIDPAGGLVLEELRELERDGQVQVEVRLRLPGGQQAVRSAAAGTAAAAYAQILADTGYPVAIGNVSAHPVEGHGDLVRTAAYARVTLPAGSAYGAGIDCSATMAVARAITSAVNRIAARSVGRPADAESAPG